MSFEKGKMSEVTPIAFRHVSQSIQVCNNKVVCNNLKSLYKKIDLLPFMREISLRIACNMTFGFELSENDFSSIYAGVFSFRFLKVIKR